MLSARRTHSSFSVHGDFMVDESSMASWICVTTRATSGLFQKTNWLPINYRPLLTNFRHLYISITWSAAINFRCDSNESLCQSLRRRYSEGWIMQRCSIRSMRTQRKKVTNVCQLDNAFCVTRLLCTKGSSSVEAESANQSASPATRSEKSVSGVLFGVDRGNFHWALSCMAKEAECLVLPWHSPFLSMQVPINAA